MAGDTLAEKLAQYEKISSGGVVPEAGAGHYLARGALQGISALADVLPNLYNLARAGYGFAVTEAGRPDLAPSNVEANPVANFLLRGYHLDEPVRPASYIGGELGAAALEGLAAGAGQGPMGLIKAAPQALAKQVLTREAQGALVGAGAGVGSHLGAQATDSPYGAIAGGLLGGVMVPSSFISKGGVTLGALRSAADTARDIKAQQLTEAASGRIEPAFSDYITGTLKTGAEGTPNAAENIAEGLRLRQLIPNFNPSVPEMSASPGLLDMQKKFALLNPKNLNAETSRTEANKQAIQDFYRKVSPEAEQPSSIRTSVNMALADYESALSNKARNIAGELPQSDQVAIGEALGTAARAEKAAARSPINKAYEDAFNAAGDAKVSPSGIVGKVEDVLGERLTQIKPQNAPQTVFALNRILGGKEKELTGRYIPPDLMALESVGGKKELGLQDLHDIRVAINQDIAAASKSLDPTSATRLYNLKQVLPEVDAAIEKMPPNAVNAYTDATRKYREDYAPRFNEGINARIFKNQSLNEPKILPDKLMSEYLKTDSQGGVTRSLQFSRLFGNNPEAKDLAKQGILDIYRQRVVNPTTGAIDQSAHDSFLRDYGRTLNSFRASGVDVVSDISRIGKSAASISESMNDLKRLSQSLKFDTVDELAADALRNPKTMGNVLMRVPADKRQTLNSVLLDKGMESGTASGLREFLDTNRKTLGMTVPKEQLSAMRDIASALEMAERAPIRGNIASGGPDMLKNMTGTSAATVFSQIRAVTQQRSSVEWAAINMALPALNKMTQTSFANVMESALHSEQSAVALRNYLLATTPQEANSWASRLLNGMKMGGKLIWDVKGPLVSNFIGPEKYGENFARSGTAIRSQMQQQHQ